jgi:hypothetical protein
MRRTLLSSVAAFVLAATVTAVAQTPLNDTTQQRPPNASQDRSTPSRQPAQGVQRDDQRNAPAAPAQGGQRDERPNPPTQGADHEDQRNRPAQGAEREDQRNRPARGAEREDQHNRPAQGGEREDQRNRPAQGAEREDRRNQPAQGAERQDQRNRPARGAEREEQRNRPAQGAERENQRNRPAQGAEREDQRNRPAQGAEREDPRNQPTQDARGERDQSGGRAVRLSVQDRTRISSIIAREKVEPARVNFSLRIGVEVPRSVRLLPLPAAIVDIVPEYRDYSYFVAEGSIVIVDLQTYEIVEVLPFEGRARAQAAPPAQPAPSRNRIQFSQSQREIIRRHATPPRTVGSAAPRVREKVVVDEDVPESIELYEFPAPITQAGAGGSALPILHAGRQRDPR